MTISGDVEQRFDERDLVFIPWTQGCGYTPQA